MNDSRKYCCYPTRSIAIKISPELDSTTKKHPLAVELVINTPDSVILSFSSMTENLWMSNVAVGTQLQY